MSDTLFIDLESRSTINLKTCGAHVYFESDTTDLWCAAYALDDGPIHVWRPGEPCPGAIREHVQNGGLVSGWNVGFERLGWEALLGPKYGWPVPAPDNYSDTAALAAAMALPRDLSGASAVLGLETQKDLDGKALMLRMARPRKLSPLTWWDDEEKILRLIEYNKIDVQVEREIRRRLVPLSALEREIWLLDARINARGIGLDVPLATAMIRIVGQATERLNAELANVTGGRVTAATQVDSLTCWLDLMGVQTDSVAKAIVADLLNREDLPEDCRSALEIRQEAAKASTAKLKTALACTGRDGRARGLMLYHGAGTGRWSGKLFQPHNLPRGSGVVKDAPAAARHMMSGDADLVALMYGPPLAAVSDCLRSVIRAAPGHDLLAADFSAIEGRVTAWLSGETWKLDAFRANDAGTGPGMYELTGAGIFGLPVEAVTKGHIARQVGKVAELALGFAGGVNAFHSMAKNYPDVRMEVALAPLWEAADPERRDRAVKRYERCLVRRDNGTAEMSREAWIASELTKVGWRAKHPATVAAWAALEDGARAAVMAPGTIVSAFRKVAFLVKRGFLWMRLPSGRCLAYGMPRTRAQVWARLRNPETGDFFEESEIVPKDRAEALAVKGDAVIERSARAAVTALGVNSMTRKYERFALYNGLIMENAVQAIARDIMAAAMLRAEAAGYPLILTVHDELVAEPRWDFGCLYDFTRVICEIPPEYEGLPIAASGWRGERYRKD